MMPKNRRYPGQVELELQERQGPAQNENIENGEQNAPREIQDLNVRDADSEIVDNLLGGNSSDDLGRLLQENNIEFTPEHFAGIEALFPVVGMTTERLENLLQQDYINSGADVIQEMTQLLQ
jgi:hypothetical protein